MTKFKDIEQILISAREMQWTFTKEPSQGYQLAFCRNFVGQKGVAWYIQGAKRKKNYPADQATPSNKIIT